MKFLSRNKTNTYSIESRWLGEESKEREANPIPIRYVYKLVEWKWDLDVLPTVILQPLYAQARPLATVTTDDAEI